MLHGDTTAKAAVWSQYVWGHKKDPSVHKEIREVSPLMSRGQGIVSLVERVREQWPTDAQQHPNEQTWGLSHVQARFPGS